MTVMKIAASVALGLALAWGGLGAWHYARKEIALQACVAEVGHENVRTFEVIPSWGAKARPRHEQQWRRLDRCAMSNPAKPLPRSGQAGAALRNHIPITHTTILTDDQCNLCRTRSQRPHKMRRRGTPFRILFNSHIVATSAAMRTCACGQIWKAPFQNR